METAPDAQAELLALRRRCAELERENAALRRSGEQAARERDDFRRRYDDLPLSCLTLDASGCVVEGNARFAALLGLAPTPLPGVDLESVIAVPQHVQRLREHLVTVFRSPGLHSCELT